MDAGCWLLPTFLTCVSEDLPVYVPFGCGLRVGVAGVCLALDVVVPGCTAKSSVWGSRSSTSWRVTGLCHFSQPRGSVGVFHCGFNFYFPDSSWSWAPVYVYWSFEYSLLWSDFQTFFLFLTESFFLIVAVCYICSIWVQISCYLYINVSNLIYMC